MQITYRFKFDDERMESFAMSFDPETMAYIPDSTAAPAPEWARLENNKCGNCPLKEADSPYCPVARNLAPVIDRFIDHISFEQAEVVVVTEAREYRKRVPLQRGVAAVFGLVMATSGCPVLDKLRPMSFTHLPLAEMTETRYRVIAMYLFAQFFRERRGLPVDKDLKGLEQIYAEIGTVNQDFIKRMRTIDMQDANFNALVNLDCFRLGDTHIMTRALDKLEKIFSPYL
jgi:hypothetical protein